MTDAYAAVPERLPIDDMPSRHPGFSDGVALYCTEAARVCLDRHHQSPITIQIDDNGLRRAATLAWVPASAGLRASHANELDATAAGAYACVLAAAELVRHMVAIHRAESLTGADYYIAPAGSTILDLETALRLEISGVDKGTPAVVRQRLNAKVEQAAMGASNVPALAGVMGFRAGLIMIETVLSRSHDLD